jgi:hypothetical protein
VQGRERILVVERELELAVLGTGHHAETDLGGKTQTPQSLWQNHVPQVATFGAGIWAGGRSGRTNGVNQVGGACRRLRGPSMNSDRSKSTGAGARASSGQPRRSGGSGDDRTRGRTPTSLADDWRAEAPTGAHIAFQSQSQFSIADNSMPLDSQIAAGLFLLRLFFEGANARILRRSVSLPPRSIESPLQKDGPALKRLRGITTQP